MGFVIANFLKIPFSCLNVVSLYTCINVVSYIKETMFINLIEQQLFLQNRFHNFMEFTHLK